MSKAPSRCDGKPIGTPMDAKSPYHAGVTMGPDQVAQIAAQHVLDQRVKRAEKNARKLANFHSQTPRERNEHFYQHKLRVKRATQMLNSVRKGRTIAWLVGVWKLQADEILAEIKWLTARRDRSHREKAAKRRAKIRQQQLGRPASVGAVDPRVGSTGNPTPREKETS